jgi:flavin reductase (DIM6/NTAB) family NADH-FMN oxidoreductase RutF
MECRLEQILPMGEVGDRLVIGRIVRIHVADAVAAGKQPHRHGPRCNRLVVWRANMCLGKMFSHVRWLMRSFRLGPISYAAS